MTNQRRLVVSLLTMIGLVLVGVKIRKFESVGLSFDAVDRVRGRIAAVVYLLETPVDNGKRRFHYWGSTKEEFDGSNRMVSFRRAVGSD